MRRALLSVLPSWQSVVRKPPNGSVLWPNGIKADQATIPDFSGSANNGTITGATWDRLPSGLPIQVFDGDDKVVHSNIDLDRDYTVSCWARWDNVTVASRQIWGVDKTAFGPAAGLHWGLVDAFLGVRHLNAVTYDDSVTYAFTPVVGTWYHLVTTYKQSTKALLVYLNTAVVITDTLTIDLELASNFTWGCNLRGTDADQNFFIGALGLRSVCAPVVWTSDQVAQDYQQTRHLIPV